MKSWDQDLDLSHLGPAPHGGWDDLVQPTAKEKGQNNSRNIKKKFYAPASRNIKKLKRQKYG